MQQLGEEVASQSDIADSAKGKKGQPKMSRSEILSPASEKLAEMRSELTKLEMEKKQIMDKMSEM